VSLRSGWLVPSVTVALPHSVAVMSENFVTQPWQVRELLFAVEWLVSRIGRKSLRQRTLSYRVLAIGFLSKTIRYFATDLGFSLPTGYQTSNDWDLQN
jgi:hypothetical protein